MQNLTFNPLLLSLALLFNTFPIDCRADEESINQLKSIYTQHHETPSDINQHLPVLRQLAENCSTVTEIGVRSMTSTWALLLGLVESPHTNKRLTSIDLNLPPMEKLFLAKRIAKDNGIEFEFIEGDDMKLDIQPSDLLFIDSLHTYCHLTYELEKFSVKAKKYIALHDTSAPWAYADDVMYEGDYSEYPETIDRKKRGLWPAVQDFLSKHPEWELQERRFNNHGFTILVRKN